MRAVVPHRLQESQLPIVWDGFDVLGFHYHFVVEIWAWVLVWDRVWLQQNCQEEKL